MRIIYVKGDYNTSFLSNKTLYRGLNLSALVWGISLTGSLW
jgi:hypothetical protein